MAYAYLLDLAFDTNSHAALHGLYRQLVDSKVGSAATKRTYHPDVTLLGAQDIYEPDAHRAVAAFARHTPPFSLSLSSIGLFATEEEVVYLGVTATTALLQLQRDFVRRMSPVVSESWAYFSEDVWVPHCTIAHHVPSTGIAALIELARRLPLPITAKVESVAVVKLTSQGNQLVERLLLGDV